MIDKVEQSKTNKDYPLIVKEGSASIRYDGDDN